MEGGSNQDALNNSDIEQYAEGDGEDDNASGYDGQTSGDIRPDTGTEASEGGVGMEKSDDDVGFPSYGSLDKPRSGGSGSVYSRQGSAVINVRGSRPNSAAVAQEIEGFDDDFMERVEEEEEQQMQDGHEEEEEEFGPSVEELIERAKQEQTQLLQANETLQRRVRQAIDLRNKGRPAVNRDMSKLDGAATRYRSSLRQWTDVLEDRDRVEAHYQATIFDMKSVLEERIKRADDIGSAYKHFRLEVARGAEHSKTGRPISDKLLARLEVEDQAKEEEVQRVRLKNIHLTNQLLRIEATLRQKEELAEGLHFIDFEQLKIENQSLNEKIEERNEDLLKLKKKTTTTVQILTHVREKLQFTEKENARLQSQMEELDKGLSERREALSKAKGARDQLRQKGSKIRDQSVYVTDANLLADFEVQKERKEHLFHEIGDCTEHLLTLSQSLSLKRRNDLFK